MSDPFELIKEYLNYLYISKMTIIYEQYPSLDLEYTDNGFRISLSYLDNHPKYVFQSVIRLYNNLVSFSKNKTISRIHISNATTTAVIYGKLFNHEIDSANQYNIVEFKQNKGLKSKVIEYQPEKLFG